MKAFAFVLLCALAAVQGRYTARQSTSPLVSLGENPWLVHLRIAVSTSGLLNTGAGSLIANNWVLTSAKNVADARFIWVFYGFVKVINPSLVTETSAVRINPNYNATTGENNIALINLKRFIHSTSNIKPIPLGIVVAGPGKVCIAGPRGVLHCFHINVARDDNGGLVISGGKIKVISYDYGTPLVSHGVQIGLLVGPGSGSEDSVGEFLATDLYFDWIASETGLDLNPEAAPEAVHFVQ